MVSGKSQAGIICIKYKYAFKKVPTIFCPSGLRWHISKTGHFYLEERPVVLYHKAFAKRLHC